MSSNRFVKFGSIAYGIHLLIAVIVIFIFGKTPYPDHLIDLLYFAPLLIITIALEVLASKGNKDIIRLNVIMILISVAIFYGSILFSTFMF